MNPLTGSRADSHFNAAIETLVERATATDRTDARSSAVPLSRGLDQVPAEPATLTGKITIREAAGLYSGFTWAGVFTKHEEEALVRWAQIPSFSTPSTTSSTSPRSRQSSKPWRSRRSKRSRRQIGGKLTVEANSINWQGSLSTQADLDALNTTATMGGAVFQANYERSHINVR